MSLTCLVFEERANTAALVPTAGGVNAPYATTNIVGGASNGTPTATPGAARRYFELGSNEAVTGNPNRECNNLLANVLAATWNFATAEVHEVEGRSRLVLVFDNTAAAVGVARANNIRVYAFDEVNQTPTASGFAGDPSLSDASFVSIEDGVTTLASFLGAFTLGGADAAQGGISTAYVNLPGNRLGAGGIFLGDQQADLAAGATPNRCVLKLLVHSVAGRTRIVVLVATSPHDQVTVADQQPLP